MKKLFCLFISCVLMLAGCAPGGGDAASDGKITAVASLFPQYDFTRIVGGDRVSVKLLLPPGSESHTFDPRPADISGIYAADLFIYTGAEMEPWAARILDGMPESLRIVDASSGVEAIRESHGEEEHDHDHGGEEHEHDEHEDHDHYEEGHAYDPHIWLDPTLAMVMVDNIAAGLCAADPEGVEYYLANAERYKAELDTLDMTIWEAVRARKTEAIVFGGRFAYLYFLRHYELPYLTAYDSCSSQSEPSFPRIAELTRYISEHNTPCVYHEELADPVVARALCEGTGAKPLLFSTAHSVTRTQFDDGITYLDIMYANLENLKVGLGN